MENRGNVRNQSGKIMIAAAASGSGKTLLTCALLEVLKRRGIPLCSFKCGPDYIDPLFHRTVLGIPSENLDTWFSGREGANRLFRERAASAEMAVIEGVMGLFDGLGGVEEAGSAYDLARAVDAPVVLVVNARGMGRSLIPLVMGFLSYDREKRIRGILLNRISGTLYDALYTPLTEEIRRFGHPACLIGYFPERKDLVWESRHLGLILPEERKDIYEKLGMAADQFEESVDTELLLAIAEEVSGNSEGASKPEGAPEPEGASKPEGTSEPEGTWMNPAGAATALTLAVARDEAFCFYYEANLRELERLGVRILPFSPLHDRVLPEGISGLLLGGGYPELYLRELSENISMRDSIRDALERGLPSLAECGGFMYLHESIADLQGNIRPMVGAVPAETRYRGRLTRFGYVEIRENVPDFLPAGQIIRGHEFHYYDSTDCGDACTAVKPVSGKSWPCIHAGKNRFWGFPHLYYPSAPGFVRQFVERMRAAGV